MSDQLRILAILFVFLLFGAIIIYGNLGDEQPQTNIKFFNFDQDQIDSFQINNFTSGLLFKKQKDNWLVKRVENELTEDLEQKSGEHVAQIDNDFQPANSHEVSKALSYLFELKNLKPISTESTEPGIYEINKYSLHLIFYDKNGAELGKIYIGKQGPDPLTSFLKKPDSPEVFLVKQDFRMLFVRNFDDWLEVQK